MPAARRAVSVSAACVLVLTACSNTESPINRTPRTGTGTASAVAGVQTITLDVGDDYRFRPSTFVVHPGMVKVVIVHTGTGAPHDFQVTKDPTDYVPLVSGGQTGSTTFVAPAVSKSPYDFVCTIHTRQGMTGQMYVRNP